MSAHPGRRGVAQKTPIWQLPILSVRLATAHRSMIVDQVLHMSVKRHVLDGTHNADRAADSSGNSCLSAQTTVDELQPAPLVDLGADDIRAEPIRASSVVLLSRELVEFKPIGSGRGGQRPGAWVRP